MFQNAHEGANMTTKILRFPEVKARTGLARSSIYKRMKARTFPKQIQLGPRTMGWLEDEIEAWLTECVKKSRPEESKRLRDES